MAMAEPHFLVPDCRVLLQQKPLTAPIKSRLARASVSLDADLFAQCVLVFHDPECALINGKDFPAGASIAVEVGFAGRRCKVFEGEVVALEPTFSRDQPSSLRVICFDSLHRLALTQMTRAFNNVDAKEIVAAIAREHGLTAEAPVGTKEHVLQANVSDAVFLRRLSQKYGQQLRIEGKKLIVAPPPKGKQVRVGPNEVRKLKVRISAQSQVSDVSVHAWDPKAKREISGRAKPQGPTQEGAKQHGKGTLSLAGHDSAPDVATAEAMAKGRLRKLAEGYVTGSGEMLGNPAVVPGALLALEGVDKQMDGTWRVDRSQHEFDRRGYSVSFRAVRVAKKKPPPPAKPPARKPAPAPPPAATPQSAPPAGPAATQPASAPAAAQGVALDVLVVDASGNPRRGVFWKLRFAGGTEQTGLTDAEGHLRATVPQGTARLSFPDFDGGEA